MIFKIALFITSLSSVLHASFHEDPLEAYFGNSFTDDDFDEMFPNFDDDTEDLYSKSLENDNPYITKEMWDKVRPYLMPHNHPIRAKLDKIFKEFRATVNSSTAAKAGFEKKEPAKFSFCVITKHKKLKGYYFKFFYDFQSGQNDCIKLATRAAGAASINEAITRLGLESMFKAPKKWLYALPEHPAPPEGTHRKNFILIAEDMLLLPSKVNRAKWKNNNFSEKRLRGFYALLKDQGLDDSVHPFNVPFCRDGKIAFVDTEHHSKRFVNYGILSKYLSKKNQKIWESIISEN
jgi:hypothetical protein